MDVKEEKNDDLKVDTKVTTTLAVKRPQPDEGDEKVKVEDDGEEMKEYKDGVVQTSQTTSTRRMSKRLRNC